MKQLIILSFASIVLYLRSNGQNTFPSSGNVGIGTLVPTYPLQVTNIGGTGIQVNSEVNSVGTSYFNAIGGVSKLKHTSGNYTTCVGVGAGAYNSGSGSATDLRGFQSNIVIEGSGNVTNGKGFMANFALLSTGTMSNAYAFYMGNFPSGITNKYGVYINDASALNYFGGSVGIGTTNNFGYKLSVNGSAIFTEARVKLYANWPDYVFKNNYKPLPLKDLENYISVNNHLPNIPSASEVQKDGINLGDMNAKLLEKIEELTLYIIELKKENDQIKEQIQKLSK